MDFIGFDLGKVFGQVCITTEDGELILVREAAPEQTRSQERAGLFFTPNPGQLPRL